MSVFHHCPIPAFAEDLPQLRACIGREELQLAHVSAAPEQTGIELISEPQDAFAVVFHLRRMPDHTLWQDGRRIEIEASRGHSLAVFDLAVPMAARFNYAINSLHFRIPRPALDEFADQVGHRPVSRLHLSGTPFCDVDPIIGGLAPVLLGTIGTAAETPLFADHLLLSVMAHVTARYGDTRGAPVRSRGGLSPWQQRRAMAMLEPGEGPVPALGAVADACGVSVAHFSRAFRASVGMPPWSWHQARRVEQAMTLLRKGDNALAEVAAATGFADQSHFTRAFRSRIGMSPGQWRREHGIR